MAKTFFPSLLLRESGTQTPRDLPLLTECAWDFDSDAPIFTAGEPKLVTGAEAVLVWAFHALRAPRYALEIYPFSYGCELTALMGQAYGEDIKCAEAQRYVREALLVSPYITEARCEQVRFVGGVLQLDCVIKSMYGEVQLHV